MKIVKLVSANQKKTVLNVQMEKKILEQAHRDIQSIVWIPVL